MHRPILFHKTVKTFLKTFCLIVSEMTNRDFWPINFMYRFSDFTSGLKYTDSRISTKISILKTPIKTKNTWWTERKISRWFGLCSSSFPKKQFKSVVFQVAEVYVKCWSRFPQVALNINKWALKLRNIWSNTAFSSG